MKNKKVVAFVCICLTAGIVAGAFVGTNNKRKQAVALLPEGFTVTAHSGAMGTVQNSVESLETGAKNADIIEFDVNFKEDGTPVLSHDAPVGGEVTLKEAFEILAKYKDTKANVDIKSTLNLPEIQKLAEETGVIGQIFFTGVGEEWVEAVKRDCPDISYYLNFGVEKKRNKDDEYINDIIEKVKQSGAVGLNFHFGGASKKLVKALHENGLLVSIWTVEKEKDIYKVISYLPDNITTLLPDRISEIIKESK